MNTPAANSSSTTLRPRNRPQNIEDDDNASFADLPSILASGSASLGSEASSRATAPNPHIRPFQGSRTHQDSGRSDSKIGFLESPNLLGSYVSPSTFAAGLWESSWSSLRGIASDLLGSDASRASSPGLSSVRKRRPLEATHGRDTSAPPARWGPSVSKDKQLASGTKEDRIAKVQAKKREMLLMANGHVIPDASGRYKRRDSDDRGRSSEPPGGGEDREALVYVHTVKPGDTLAGVMIRYNCQQNVFRKANRLWPNDSIQVRKTVILPVDACSVRGRKIADSEVPLHGITGERCRETVLPRSGTQALWDNMHDNPEDQEVVAFNAPTSPSISITLSNSENSPWKHDSWVMIDGFPEAVEIARLSRRALGYFPRSRRKSRSFSDLETPSASLELPRSSYQSTSPRETTRARSGSNSNFGTHLKGPGGVGTMSKNVRSPGPANDGLNKLFPTLQPTVTARSSFDSQRSNSSHANGLEHVSGAIEGWVRKVATKASTSLQSPASGERLGVGDLIELSEEAFELGEDSQGEEGERVERVRGRSTGSRVGDWSTEQERMLQERFPPRGRVVREASKRKS